MDTARFFLSRYDPLRHMYVGRLWQRLKETQLRFQPPGLNSIAWNLWHVARCEDLGVNRFVSDMPQVFDTDDWLKRLEIDVRHQGTGQSAAEASEITERLRLEALRDYTAAVEQRTRTVLQSLEAAAMDGIVEPATIRHVLFDEGFAHPKAAWLENAYAGWSRGKCLMHFALTHPYQHIGEISVLASLQGADAFGF